MKEERKRKRKKDTRITPESEIAKQGRGKHLRNGGLAIDMVLLDLRHDLQKQVPCHLLLRRRQARGMTDLTASFAQRSEKVEHVHQ